MDVVIIGTGGMAKEIWGLCQITGYRVLGFVSEQADYQDMFMGLPVLSSDHEWLRARRKNCVIANGSPAIRRKIAQFYQDSAHHFPHIVPVEAIILTHLKEIGNGTSIMPGGVIQPEVSLGAFVHINMGVTIGHDVTIGDYSVVNHNAGISGNVTIGEGVLIGAGATIIEGHTIGDWAIVGAGAVVTRSIPAGETWVGVPAKPMEKERISFAELYNINE